MNSDQTFKKQLVVIILLAALLRVIWSIFIPVIPVSDSFAYSVFARSVASGNGYAWEDGTLTAYWPPGTSFIYSVFFRLFGYTYVPIVIFHIVVGTVVVYLGQSLAQLIFNRESALLTALFLALWPLLIQFTTILASEIIFLVPIMSAILLVYKKKKSCPLHWLFFGLLIGIATYIRPTALPLLVIIPILAAVRHRQYRNLPGWIVIGGMSCLILMAPWSIRNTRLYGEFTTISTNFGPNLWMGNNPASDGRYESLKSDQTFENEKIRERYFKEQALDYIKSNPVEFLRLGIKRTIATFDRETIGVVWNEPGLKTWFGNNVGLLTALKLLSSLYWYLMLLSGFIGIFFLIIHERWRILTNPVFMISAFFAFIPMVTVGQDRYHIALIPMLASLAAFGIIKIASLFNLRLS